MSVLWNGRRRWWAVRRGLRKCAVCHHETSVAAGTIFHGSRLPLTTWFAAIWYVVNQKQGVSALGLQHVLEFGSYQTAWAWLHKLRRAMVLPGRELLWGVVEVDESYVGARRTGARRTGAGGRRAAGKAIVACSSSSRPPRPRFVYVISDGGWCDTERGVAKVRELRELQIPVVHLSIGFPPLSVEADRTITIEDPASAMDIIAADTVAALQVRRRR